ncbi:hypothetical protein [Chitinophaga nivalis]|uniref:Uncharacterized protein n=1 Tax=Chitinophaga nivalis TaxID=2991709 RepID=A0ABT3IG40_9BACT|nr:hypothetical protein [Chitinophaga nivalis]MCW3467380.1 hypothetical protein [Chitinophaga nivalis]MCW3482928.1 hypothetical protein [Chitinophaga nivalis]
MSPKNLRLLPLVCLLLLELSVCLLTKHYRPATAPTAAVEKPCTSRCHPADQLSKDFTALEALAFIHTIFNKANLR